MKEKPTELSQRYVTALRRHLKQGAGASMAPALTLGRRAVHFGVETLGLARIHENAVSTLELLGNKNGYFERAEKFFAEAITPIVETHRAARRSKIQLNQLNELLNRRTLQLAATNREVQRGIRRRKSVEAALKESDGRYARCLKDSLQLQGDLRQLTRQVLVTQEDERRKMSRELQDEIAQTLLAINIRLVALKQEAKGNTQGLKNEIARRQSLVRQSVQRIHRLARKFDIPHER